MAWEWLDNIDELVGTPATSDITGHTWDDILTAMNTGYIDQLSEVVGVGLNNDGSGIFYLEGHAAEIDDKSFSTTYDLRIQMGNNYSQWAPGRLAIQKLSEPMLGMTMSGNISRCTWRIMVNYETEEMTAWRITQYEDQYCLYYNCISSANRAQCALWYDFLVEHSTPPVTYQWRAVSSVSGSMGIISLTMIKNDKIEDGDASHTVLPEENIERFTDQSNTRRICLNHVKDEWFRAAESGLNYLELKYSILNPSFPNDMTIYYRFFNHYGEGNNQYYSIVFSGTLYFTGQANGQSDTYLSFIIDDENEAAMFDPVTWIKMPSSTPPVYGVEYGNISHTSNDMASIYYWLKGSPEDIDEDDPYADGSEGDGGEGNPYQPQDHIGLSSKPAESGLDVGIVTLYQPSKTELAAISQFLWSDDVLDNFKKYFNNFGDNLLSLMILPVEQEAAGIASKAFTVGNMTSDNATLQSVNYITDRYVDIDMGSFYLKRKWDSYLDVSPYSKLEVYLPYCGTHQLNTDEVVYPANKDGFLPVKPEQEIQLKLNYRIDLVTGNIVATLFVNDENRYQFTGKCGITVPLTGANYQNMVTGAITAGAGLAATIASGGLTAPLTGAAAVSGTVMASKPDVYRSGNLSGDVSMLAFDTPYLIKTIPNKPTLTNQELYTGFPSYKKGTLGEFSGYTEVIEAHIDNVSCSSEERDMILAALKGGVII